MTADKLYNSLTANTIMAKLTRLITPSHTDRHYSLDSEDDFCSGCQKVSHQQQFFSELPSPRQSHKLYKLLILLGSNHLLCYNQNVTKAETKQTNKAKYGSSLVTFYNWKNGVLYKRFFSQWLTGCWQGLFWQLGCVLVATTVVERWPL